MLQDFYTPERNVKTTIVELGGNGDFLELRPFDYKPFVAEKSREIKKHKVQARNGNLDPATAQRTLAPLVAKHLVVDWQMTGSADDKDKVKGLKTGKRKGLSDGKFDIPFSIENVALILKTPTYRAFLDFIINESSDHANFVQEDEAEDIKN